MDSVKLGFLKNKFKEDQILKELRESIQKQVGKVNKDLGPSISEQVGIIEGWWKKMAEEFNPDIHHSFIRDLPIGIVTEFLVRKRIALDNHNA